MVGVFDVKALGNSGGVKFRVGTYDCQLSHFDFRDDAARFQGGASCTAS